MLPPTLSVRHQAELESLQQACHQQRSEEFSKSYAQRAGIEGRHSQAVRAPGLRRTHYFGLAKTSLQHLFTAAVINLIRLDALVPDELAS